LGGEVHRAKVREIKALLTKKGLEVPSKEYRFKVPGRKIGRFADVVGLKHGKPVEIYQVGKVTKSGAPILRELKAIQDIEESYRNEGNLYTYQIRTYRM
jgi:hypothetical protein